MNLSKLLLFDEFFYINIENISDTHSTKQGLQIIGKILKSCYSEFLTILKSSEFTKKVRFDNCSPNLETRMTLVFYK